MAMAQEIMTVPRRPIVSVCIANYDGMMVIDACLRSVLAQDCGFPVEIIVHDDASTDNSVAHIRANYPGVTVIESTENVGFCVANNRMAKSTCGEYLLLLNNDAALFPDALRTLHATSASMARPAILGLPQYSAENGALIDRGSLFDLFLNPMPNLDAQCKDVGMIIGACLWIPAALWLELGGFPEWFHTLAEDMYLCCAARLRDYPVKVVPASGFHHWVGKSLGGGKVTTDKRLVTSRKRRILSERNKTFVMILFYPGPLLALVFPLHLLLLAVEGISLSLIKHDGRLWREVYWHCFTSVWRERRHLAAVRASAQAGRAITLVRWLQPFTLLPHKLRLLIRHGLPEIK